MYFNYYTVFAENLIMTENKNEKKGTHDANKIIIYMVFMTTLFLLYCSDKNYEIEKSIDYHSAEYHSNYNKVITSENSNIHFVKLYNKDIIS